MSTPIPHPDLTQRPPRSVRVRLGGYIILPRVLDKCRALLAGKNGEYNYDCSMDRHFLKFVGLEGDALKAEIATGKGDGELLAWIEANAQSKRTPWEIAAWSAYHERRTPDSDAETLAFFAGMLGKITTTREDIQSWFDFLDLDDHVTFGGKP
jgi:hypothetical protein